jgi:hypothetical protein
VSQLCFAETHLNPQAASADSDEELEISAISECSNTEGIECEEFRIRFNTSDVHDKSPITMVSWRHGQFVSVYHLTLTHTALTESVLISALSDSPTHPARVMHLALRRSRAVTGLPMIDKRRWPTSRIGSAQLRVGAC